MTPNLTLALIGFGLALAASYSAHRAGALNGPGVIAATILGTVVFAWGGWQWAVLLLVFFYTSSGLSRTFRARKAKYASDYAKGDRRDAAQVAANGAIAGIFVLLHAAAPGQTWPWIAFAGALAAANADTWATELGVFGGSKPRFITNLGREVEAGTSGGVSPAGTIAALGGSSLIGICAAVLEPSTGWQGAIAIALGGWAGSLIDSLLGATLQGIYYCPQDKRETERHPFHSCGAQTSLVRGYAWITNDWVNAGCTLTGALLAWALRIALGSV